VAEAQSTTNKHIITFHPVPTAMPTGFWDRDRIRQIVRNLLSNAIKYSPAGGPIEVRIEHFGSVARIILTDQGVGIDRNAMPRLFDPFYRVPVTAAGTEGTGLGLGVTKALVEAHGGWIELESSPGRGSTFRVTLPYGTPAFV
jgi:signal transduction histidine kinase